MALYSGGVDSYCMSYLCKPDVLLSVNMGGRYGDAEAEAMKVPPNFGGYQARLACPVIGEREDKTTSIVPGRNAFLALFGSWYGSTLLLASVYEEAHVGGADKDEGFAAALAGLFDHMYQPQRWLPQGRTVRLELPVHNLTKAQLVGLTIAAGHSPELLAANTFSCYTPVVTKFGVYGDSHREPEGWGACGQCSACARKWAAFSVWGVDVGFPRPDALQAYVQEAKRLHNPVPSQHVNDEVRKHSQRTEQWVSDQMHAWYGHVRDLREVRSYAGVDTLAPHLR